MASTRYVIVNADDFGQSRGVNRGIIHAHEHGIVTSASLMVRWPASAEAAAYARERRNLSVGLHVDLGEWACNNDGAWVPLYEVAPIDDALRVREEVSRQVATFRGLVGTDPTHIDSHQHVHLREPARSVIIDLASRIGVPLRHFHPEIRHCGKFYGQTAEGSPLSGVICVDGLLELLGTLPAGVTELGCHPGEADDLATTYRTERVQELETLCDARVRAAISAMDIELRSFTGAPRCLNPGAVGGATT